eukprot:476834-Rhodomonas_salina.2
MLGDDSGTASPRASKSRCAGTQRLPEDRTWAPSFSFHSTRAPLLLGINLNETLLRSKCTLSLLLPGLDWSGLP